MTTALYKIGIVGAGTLLGKELAESLAESSLGASDFVLLDDPADPTVASADSENGLSTPGVAAQLAPVGDEAAFIQAIDADSFRRMDFAFFAGSGEATRAHWKSALRAGASILDLTGELENEPRVLVRAPWVSELLSRNATASAALPDFLPDLKTPAIVPAHPAAVLLALVLARLQDTLPVRSVAATLIEPASQHGRAALDELHQQTVSLLSFQNLPREQYDAQVAFNVLPSLGDAAKVRLAAAEARIRRHYALLSSGRLPDLAVQIAQAPVFHGYVASVMVEFASPVPEHQVELALQRPRIDVVLGEADAPSNLNVSGQQDILVRIRPEPPGDLASTRYWLWIAADNLKLQALNAIACAEELRRLRPQGKIQ